MRRTTLATLAALTLLATPALAQDDTPLMREDPGSARDGLVKKTPAPAAQDTEDAEDGEDGEDAMTPLDAPYDPGPAQNREAFERRLAGWTAIGIGLPAAAWGASRLGEAANETQDRAARNRAAQAGGAALLGGAAVAAQGAAALREEDRKEKEARAAERRARLFPATQPAPDAFLITLERDAEVGRAQRDTAGTVVLLGGILAGALVAAIPSQDSDRVALVIGGAALAAVSTASGIVLWNTPSSEELLLEEARQRP
jgi:hypothetical protein